MPFVKKPRTFKPIGTVTLGSGDTALTLGGGRSQPLCFFDGKPGHPPAVGVEVTDVELESADLPRLQKFYEGAATVAERVARAASLPGAAFVCLRFEGADPGGLNRTVEECVALAKAAAAASPKPLCIAGSRSVEKDTELFKAIAAALEKQNILFLSAREENYKTVGAAAVLAYGHTVAAESACDINLGKQLNVLLTQLGVPKTGIVMNLGSAAAGYGFEYVSSTMDLVKAAALEQGDNMLQMPVITPVASETWTVKESMVAQSEMPEWGGLEERGIQMETVTAAACLASGSDAVILRHPVSIQKIAALIAALA